MTEAPQSDPVMTELRERVSGPVILPGEDGYEQVAQPWNLLVTQRPRAVVVPSEPRHIAEAVQAAAALAIPVAVQATGHGVGAPADGALLIATQEMQSVTVDALAATARVAAGAVWSQVVEPAQEVGLVPLMGSAPNVGAVGYTLGGGVGWLARRYGLACDTVRSLEVVTADGRIRTVTPEVDGDLFWALRGAGPAGLGVVTSMEIDLFPVASGYGGNLVYPAEMAPDVLRRYREWIRDVPEELTSSVALMNLPPLDIVPEPLRGQSWVMVRGLHCGATDDAEALLAFWRQWREPAMDMFGEMALSEVATVSNDPEGPLPGLSDTAVLAELSDEAIETLANHAFPAAGPRLLVQVELRHVGGATARAPRVPGAYDLREVELLSHTVALVPEPGLASAAQGTVGALQQDLAPLSTGRAYLNFLDGTEKMRAAPAAFSPEILARLAQVKQAYDPTGVFRFGLDL